MPFASIYRPALGISLLKAELAKVGVTADVIYFNILLAEHIGRDRYCFVSDLVSEREIMDTPDEPPADGIEALDRVLIPHDAMAGEWLFSQAFYGSGSLGAETYLRDVVPALHPDLGEAEIQVLRDVRNEIPSFLHACLSTRDWDQYDVVGFTSTFQQNMPSLCLARTLKSHHPDIAIAFGGANCEGEMGLELLRSYDFIDYVAMGEADRSFPELVQALRRGESPGGISGIAWRADGKSMNNGPAELVQDLDNLPYPDYSEYFDRFRGSPIGDRALTVIAAETARGCWWGQRSHCTFCGLNGTTMAFRAKSPERAYLELQELSDRHSCHHFLMVDQIMEMDYFKALLPELSRADPPLSLIYETKSNLKREQVRMLARAGVQWIQPGIESLSTPILKLMRKGVTGPQNVALLKWCHQFGVTPMWNLLCGFPGEDPDAYQKVFSMLERMVHLEPPSVSRVTVHRYSPYFETPDALGVENVRPAAVYRHIYPFDDDAIARLAYTFDFDFKHDENPDAYIGPLVDFCEEWRALDDRGDLIHRRHSDGSADIRDTRPNRVLDQLELDPLQNALYEFCDAPRGRRAIDRFLNQCHPGARLDPTSVTAVLDYLVETRLMICENQAWVSLAPIELEKASVGNMIPLRPVELASAEP